MYTVNKIETFHPAHRRVYEPSRVLYILCLLCAINAALPSAALAGKTYYVDPIAGRDESNGTSDDPWKTIAEAESTVANGDTVYLRSGSYGEVYINRTGLNRSSWADGVTYIAEDANTPPVFDKLDIRDGEDRYLTFQNISVIASSDSDYDVVTIKSSHIKMLNCTISGRWVRDGSGGLTSFGVKVDGETGVVYDVLIDGCDIQGADRGIILYHDIRDNIVVRNSHIHKVATSFITTNTNHNNGEIIIENNHLYDRRKTPGAHGSGIEVRDSHITIRGNVIRDFGGSGGIRFYGNPPAGFAHEDMLIENNLIYDSQGVTNQYFGSMKRDITIRNNTFIGLYSSASGPNKYGTAMVLGAESSSYGVPNLKIHNNVFVGFVGLAHLGSNWMSFLEEDNNIFWGIGDTASSGFLTNPPGYRGNGISNSIIIQPGGDDNYFEGSGNFFFGGELFDYYSYTNRQYNTHDFVIIAVDPVAKTFTIEGDYPLRFLSGDTFDVYELPHTNRLGTYNIASAEAVYVADNDVTIIYVTNNVDSSLVGKIITHNDPYYPDSDSGGVSSHKQNLNDAYQLGASQSGSPVFDHIGDKFVGENETLTFDVNAIDPDDDTITYSVQNKPTTATFSGQTFSWTPTHSDAGEYRVTFFASDGTHQDSETIIIRGGYDPNLDPIGDYSVTEHDLLEFTISATDADGNPLTYSASNRPQGANFDANTGEFDWTPTYQDVRTHSVTFTVTDDVYTDSETITITVDFKDSDSDSLPDSWETLYFGNLLQGPDDDPDNDGLTNLEEYQRGTDPTVFDEVPSDLMLHMKLDDDPSDGNVIDSSSYGNHGTCSGTAYPTVVPGKLGNAYEFDGIDDYIEIGAEDTPSPWTAAFWVKREDSSNSNAALLDSSDYSLKLEQYPDTNNVGFTAYGVDDYTFNYEAPIGAWTHLVFIGTSMETRLYVNGALTDTISGSISCPMAQVSSSSKPVKGTIDEVRVYNRALSASEVSGLANTSGNTYTLSITAVGGSVTKSPDKASYNHGETVSLQAFADTGYNFVNWTGDVSGSSNPATIVMDADKSVTANFAIDTIDTFTLDYAAGAGGSLTGNTAQVVDYGSDGTAVTAVPDLNYHFVDWSDASTDNPRTDTNVTATVNVTANFAFAIDTFTLDYAAGAGGSLTGNTAQVVDYGSDGTAVTAVPDLNYHFVDWSDASTDNPRTDLNVTANVSVTANFVIDEQDDTAPTVTNLSPDPNDFMSDSVPLNSLILLDITDTGKGVDRNTVEIRINNDLIYDGDNETAVGVYDSTGHVQTIKGICRRIGSSAAYKYIFQPDEKFDYDQELSTAVNAADLATLPNTMSEYQYSLISEVRSFGENKILHSGSNNENWGPLTTVCDGSRNIWVAWPQGVVGSRDIYVGKLVAGTDSFVSGGVVPVTDDIPDQGNPVIAVDSSDKLYLAWQDNRYGEWDIFVSTSTDGINWPTQTKVTDSDSNQTNPAIVIDGQNNAHVVWQDDREGNQDIYIATSSDGFVTTTVSRITSDISDQVEPAIAADSGNTIYIVWTDTRNNGKKDIYGAASNGSWTNIPIVTEEESSQSSPAIATEAVGSVLHLVWLDDTNGDDDIYYATSDGLPASPLTGSSIIDDTTGADQLSPVIITTGYTGNDLKVFACWRDERNLDANTDVDLYAVEITASGTNIYVDDEGTKTDQSEPAIGIDGYGHPYLVWINERTDICYAGSTFIEPVALASSTASVSSKTTVGTVPSSITNIDDVSVEIPAGAYLCDVKVTISRIRNPHKPPSNNRTFLYEFGPSGTIFSEPVTITIPYNATTLVSSPSAYWYNPLTGYSQEGITDVEVIQISSGLYALRFKTTHFSIFGGGGPFGVFGGGGGGGGCSMSPNSQDSIAELLLPYIGLAVAMVILKLRDRRKMKARNIAKS